MSTPKLRMLDTLDMLRTEPPPFEGWVYCVGGKYGPVKVGWTGGRDVDDRVRAFQTGNPVELRVLAKREGSQNRERDLHRSLCSHRIRGEWFDRAAAFAMFGIKHHEPSNKPMHEELYELRLRHEALTREYQLEVACARQQRERLDRLRVDEIQRIEQLEQVVREQHARIVELVEALEDANLQLGHAA